MRNEPVSVLMIEDNPLFAEQIRLAIQAIGIVDMTYCETGSKALWLLDRNEIRFDLALVDLGLPDMDGIDVVSALRQRYAEIPIMVISVISSERKVLGAIRAGANGYLLKSDAVTSITQAITEVLQGNYPISPALARSLFKLAKNSPDEAIQTDAFKLSPREIETIQHIAHGHSYQETALLMGISLSTVQSNIRALYKKLNAHSQVQAIAKARDAGII